jgi:hypothetical protein
MKLALALVLLTTTMAQAIDTKVCDGNKGRHRHRICVKLVNRVNKLADVPGPTCPVPPECPQANLGQTGGHTADGTQYTQLVGVLADPNFPACIGKFFFASVGPHATMISVGPDCTGQLAVEIAPQPLLVPDQPFIGSLTGTLQCACCGALHVNAQFVGQP